MQNQQETPDKKSKKIGLLNRSYLKLDKIEIFLFPDQIMTLNLSNNNLQQISNLNNLKSLKELDLSHNFIKDLEGLDSCKTIISLNLSHNFIENLEFFPKIMLNDLNLNKNNIKSLKGWENLKELKRFTASSNQIKEIGFLMNLNKYEELIFYDNKLENIYPNTFEYANSLVYLDLSKNRLRDLGFLTPLKNIKVDFYLFLSIFIFFFFKCFIYFYQYLLILSIFL